MVYFKFTSFNWCYSHHINKWTLSSPLILTRACYVITLFVNNIFSAQLYLIPTDPSGIRDDIGDHSIILSYIISLSSGVEPYRLLMEMEKIIYFRCHLSLFRNMFPVVRNWAKLVITSIYVQNKIWKCLLLLFLIQSNYGRDGSAQDCHKSQLKIAIKTKERLRKNNDQVLTNVKPICIHEMGIKADFK